jgi:hypothetical protein
MAGSGGDSTLAMLVKAKARVAKTALAIGLGPKPRVVQPPVPPPVLPDLDNEMLNATREFFKGL